MSGLHPLPKLVVALVWLATAILVFDLWFQIALAFTAALALILLDRVSPLKVLLLTIPFMLFGFGFLTTSLVFRQEADFALHVAEDTLVRSKGFSAGLILFFRAVACGMVSMAFALTTDPGRLVRALMAGWRLPPRVGYALFSAFELVPDLAGAANEMRLARAMRRGRPPRRLPGPGEAASLVVPLLAFAIRRAGRAAIAMEARGLAPNRARTIIDCPRLAARDAIFVAVSLSLLGLLVVLAARGWAI
ncbi:energy-coupling factor transporter transmembrane component T family protein [Nitratireductor mangrovi]|nr:energy-coupling factor transporter transmembrane component T [Nitratireductor mangrovi]